MGEFVAVLFVLVVPAAMVLGLLTVAGLFVAVMTTAIDPNGQPAAGPVALGSTVGRGPSTRGPASRTASLTPSANAAKLSANIQASREAIAS
jgi:hypothetical protein